MSTTRHLDLIIEGFVTHNVLEDRLEYSIEDFMIGHDLSHDDAALLQAMLHTDDPHYTAF